jgi:hypothetical protein
MTNGTSPGPAGVVVKGFLFAMGAYLFRRMLDAWSEQ